MQSNCVASRDEWLEARKARLSRETARVFYTYSSCARGPEELIGTSMILDRAPNGRNEDSTLNLVRRHDEYRSNPVRGSCCSAKV